MLSNISSASLSRFDILLDLIKRLSHNVILYHASGPMPIMIPAIFGTSQELCLPQALCLHLLWHLHNTLILRPLQWRHNERDGVTNHWRFDCLPSRLFRCRPKNPSELRVTGLCVGNPPATGGFPTQTTSNAENISISWRNHDNWACYNGLALCVSYFHREMGTCLGSLSILI